MILEGLVTTVTLEGRPHVSAMGPTFRDDEVASGHLQTLVLRPFATSQTAANLVRTRRGVFHLSDDVLLLARIVAGEGGDPAVQPATTLDGFVLASACRAFEFEVTTVDDSAERLRLDAKIVATHDLRPFTGFNRAAHAVVEAAILVTRLHLLDPDDVRRRLADLLVLVDKTGGQRERDAFALLQAHAGSRPA